MHAGISISINFSFLSFFSFVVETVTNSNYRVITISHNVSTNDVLSFSVDGEIVTTHTATQDDMDAGGFEQNLTSKGLVSAPMWYVTAFTNYAGIPGMG